MLFINKKYLIFYFSIFLLSFQNAYSNSDVKVAVIHFEPLYGEIDINIDRLIVLAEEAGNNGAKIIVFPELATSGYSYFSRYHIRNKADSIPGKTTNHFSEIAKKYEMYIVLGLVEHCIFTNQYYNSAVLINPNGYIGGVYRKHSHLIESSWSSLGRGKVPVFETIYGKLAILICADINYSELSIQAMIKSANFLILPTNGGIDEDLLRVRAIEGNCHIILANRYGNERNFI